MGAIEEDPAKLDPALLGEVVGPTVHLNSFSSETGLWKGSVQIICKEQPVESVSLTYAINSEEVGTVEGQQILGFDGWLVVRYVTV